MTKQFGFTADFTYNTQRPNMSNFAPAEMPNVDKITIPLGRAGIYFNNDWISRDLTCSVTLPRLTTTLP